MFTTTYRYNHDEINKAEHDWYWMDGIGYGNPTWWEPFPDIETCFENHDRVRKQELLNAGVLEE